MIGGWGHGERSYRACTKHSQSFLTKHSHSSDKGSREAHTRAFAKLLQEHSQSSRKNIHKGSATKCTKTRASAFTNLSGNIPLTTVSCGQGWFLSFDWQCFAKRASRQPPGSLPGCSWERLDAIWGHLGPIFRRRGAPRTRGRFWELSWAILGCECMEQNSETPQQGLSRGEEPSVEKKNHRPVLSPAARP